ncbi:MAG TPA: peroxiredoxin [Candidatus Binataceae bacterium]|nr:peroxiredoxin [Candidatus Binataceae bacterium]
MKMLASLVVFAVVAIVAIVVIRPRIARAELLKQGQIAPGFTTQMVQGDQVSPVSLSDLRGKTVILYFYPKDETPGCTKEACAFRDGYARFQSAGLVVLGCSVQDSDAHRAFIKKYNIPFPLLLDPDKKIATEYGAANGIPILGLDRRITYVIDGDGRIAKVYPSVDPSINATEILTDLKVPEHPAAAPPATSPAPGAAAD